MTLRLFASSRNEGSPATKVSMLRDSLRMFLEVLLTRWNALRGLYPRVGRRQ